jgi:hypothetical protein
MTINRTVLWDVNPYSMVVYRNLKEHNVSIFRDETYVKEATSLLGYFFDAEYGGSMFL